jgi:catechol 2,3-dioxygenase
MLRSLIHSVGSIDLGVTDLHASKNFYTKTWCLSLVSEDDKAVLLRGSGTRHHILALHQRPRAEVLRLNFSAPDRRSVDLLYQKVSSASHTPPTPLEEPAQGYGFAFKDLEGRTIRVIADQKTHIDRLNDPHQPTQLTHVVLNSPQRKKTIEYYSRLFDLRVIDETSFMTFLCASNDHHCIAVADHSLATLNHIAFETPSIDAVMRGVGRLRENGVTIEWGVGRHGPGNNVFAYFLGPNKEIIEYTSEVMKVDDHYPSGGPDDWGFPPGRSDHWGIMPGPSDAYKHAQSVIGFAEAVFDGP